MLVLTRKIGERIIIGDDLILEIIRIEPGRVRLGFIGDPKKFRIHRSELRKKIIEGLKHASDQQADAAPTGGSPGSSKRSDPEPPDERCR